MNLFDQQFDEFINSLEQMGKNTETKEVNNRKEISWPSSKNRNLVLSQDTSVELGNPKDESVSFLLWENDSGRIKDECITIIGPDLPESSGKRLPFGKVVLIGGSDFNSENAYDRYREMESVRYDLDLKGYMMRGVSQFQREWSRVSHEAIENGFSFHVLGSEMIKKFKELDYIKTVEVFFVTSGREDVVALKKISDKAARIIGAMNKMVEEMSIDCNGCEYNDVCEDVVALRAMRKSRKK